MLMKFHVLRYTTSPTKADWGQDQQYKSSTVLNLQPLCNQLNFSLNDDWGLWHQGNVLTFIFQDLFADISRLQLHCIQLLVLFPFCNMHSPVQVMNYDGQIGYKLLTLWFWHEQCNHGISRLWTIIIYTWNYMFRSDQSNKLFQLCEAAMFTVWNFIPAKRQDHQKNVT